MRRGGRRRDPPATIRSTRIRPHLESPRAFASLPPNQHPTLRGHVAQDSQTLHGDGISAVITGQGAELVSLQDAHGFEFLWQAGPEWRRHSPVLFPIGGRL